MRRSPADMQLKTRSLGLSLVELMISLLLGALLASGIIAVYLDSKRNFMAEEEMARIQENGRFAINLLKRELTLAGFYGGSFAVDDMAPQSLGGADCATAWALNADDPIELIDEYPGTGAVTTTTGTTLTCLTGSEIQDDTDIFSVKRTAGEPTLKDGDWADGIGLSTARVKQWYLKKENYGETVSWLYASSSGDFPSSDYASNSRVDYWQYKAGVFFIRDYSTVAGDDIPTLCVVRLVGDAMGTECLVEGIEDMQIEFGVDTDADSVPNRYLDAPTAAQMNDVVTARIYLLLRSLAEVPGYDNDNVYTLGQKAAFTANDGYMRRIFSTTVLTRNAILPAIN